MEDVDEFRNGKKVTVSKKVFPGYLLVRCYLDDESWLLIRFSGTEPLLRVYTETTTVDRVDELLAIGASAAGVKE